ncbi:MAG: hypothetical protein CMH52_03295 [Myxococcales bacterium]|nr:hypothetical protein [Myxococcales bacterium]
MQAKQRLIIGLMAFGLIHGCGEDAGSSSGGLDGAPMTDAGSGTAMTDTMAAPMIDMMTAPMPDASGADSEVVRPDVERGMSTQQLMHDGVMRDYKVYVPEGYAPGTPTPTLMNFHGGDMNADGQIAIADMRALADEEGFILIYPEGSITEGEQTWNMLLPSPTNKSDADDFGFTAAMLDAESVRLNIDTDRVYATGYSNGAGFAYGLACQLSDRIAAIAPVAGLMWTDMITNCMPTHPTPVVIFNGTQDFERPYDGYPGFMISVEEAVNHWTSHNGITDAPVMDTLMTQGLTIERNTYSGGQAGTSVVRYKFINGGHVWFDLDNDGADLNRTIWDFVSQYDLNGLRAE